MSADPQENFNVASLPEYEEVLEDKDDGDDSSWRKDALIYMLGKLTRRMWMIFVGPLSRVRPRNGILALVVVVLVVPLRSEFIGEL